MKSTWKIALLATVMGILTLFYLGLGVDTRYIPSPLLDKPAFPFSAEGLDGKGPVVLEAKPGKWVLVNFWGSWCVSCVAEHPYLMELARKTRDRSDFAMIGVDFRDTREGGLRFLSRHGDPGYRHAFDPEQRIAIDWGVYGAPESFLVDPQGTIRLKRAGPLYPGWFEQEAMPLIQGMPP
ncbi:MAG: DsbE family thiol:disulfide interchange protein [Magnetococcales bacterium]|nr:DsbE family thiol:disulfide interchange protein [Magnetococcales bacterium]MBF0157789.1 DsbE family thiol:disulfide interchange protein [Magnetococcales bacterium]